MKYWSLLLAVGLFLTAGCSKDKKDSEASATSQERVPLEVSGSPEEATQQYQRGSR